VITQNYGTVNVPIQVPSAQRVIALTPGGTINIRSKHSERRRVRLLDANGIPVGRLSNPFPSRDLAPSPGTTPLLNIAPGTYTIQLLGAGDAVAGSTRVEVQEGRATDVEL
jgi:hypothetical protein